MSTFYNTMTHYQRRVDTYLQNTITEYKNTPVILRDAMQYAMTAGGKRLRPILV